MSAPRLRSALLLAAALCAACESPPPDAGTIVGPPATRQEIAKRTSLRGEAASRLAPRAADAHKQILFGDLHVHSTFSVDAFIYSLPIFNGEGAHPPADACDFARHCSGLDFFSINDHAESLTPELWEKTRESIRRCNEIAGDTADPDLSLIHI